MNRNVTASFSLSVFMVVLFAVLLYQPEGPGSSSVQASPNVPADSHQPISDPEKSRPRLTPGTPLPEASTGPTSSDQPSTSPAFREETVEQGVVREGSRPSPGGQAEETKPGLVPALPSSTFTYAMPGESLADIAVRVYGSPDSARKLWMANRDIIDSPDTTPRGGTLLRTP